ncbi:endonuclease/exonuclease/phosphatase family protein [Pseudomonas sp. AIG]
MPLTIMTWNAQHFDEQNATLSEAYREKLAFLVYYLKQRSPDIFALFETGKSGAANTQLIRDLSAEYSPISVLQPESAKTKVTTLGSIVFVKNAIAREFTDISAHVPLDDKEQRGVLLIRHRTTDLCYGFYHANASKRALGNIINAIAYIQGLKVKLVFFGGDLNVPTDGNPDVIMKMHKLTPAYPGYTHVNILSDDVSSSRRELRDMQELGHFLEHTPKEYFEEEYKWNHAIDGTPRHPTTRLSLLDYAYVHELEKWSAVCEGSANSVTSGESVRHRTTVIQKICLGMPIRSDHFPVLFTYGVVPPSPSTSSGSPPVTATIATGASVSTSLGSTPIDDSSMS